MQPIKRLTDWLSNNASADHYLFKLHDFRALFPDLSEQAFKTLLSRAVRSGCLDKVCRGVYVYKKAIPPSGVLLFHAAALLRSNAFNYISLETALSDAGVISQMPIQWVTIMSSGRSNTIDCGSFGKIEYIHTAQKPDQVMEQLAYDARCHLWRASIRLAIRDMKAAKRNCDLIDWDIVNELI